VILDDPPKFDARVRQQITVDRLEYALNGDVRRTSAGRDDAWRFFYTRCWLELGAIFRNPQYVFLRLSFFAENCELEPISKKGLKLSFDKLGWV